MKQNLTKLRTDAGLSFRQLSNYISIDPASLCRIEKTQNQIKQQTIERLAWFFQCDADYILDNEGTLTAHYESADSDGDIALTDKEYDFAKDCNALTQRIVTSLDTSIVSREITRECAERIFNMRNQKSSDPFIRKAQSLNLQERAVIEPIMDALIASRGKSE